MSETENGEDVNDTLDAHDVGIQEEIQREDKGTEEVMEEPHG